MPLVALNREAECSDFPLGVISAVSLGAFSPGDRCAPCWEVTLLGSPVGALHVALRGTLVGILASLGWDFCLLDAGSQGQDIAVLGTVLAPPKSALGQ